MFLQGKAPPWGRLREPDRRKGAVLVSAEQILGL